LTTILLARTGINVRPLGGPGDRARDAVAGLYRAEGGEPLAVTISLNQRWQAKIRADLGRVHDFGFRPETVISVTNRPTGQQHRPHYKTGPRRSTASISQSASSAGW
jgi:hypothetical protein